jgi:hypothetical protein
MKEEVCGPLSNKKYTCYSSESLHKLKNLWNKRHPDAKISATEDKKIWDALRGNMKKTCKSESCWLQQNFAKHNLTNELRYYTFAPEAPKEWKKNINEWLSSVDIENVMKQYEEKYPDFVFLGPSPIDFDAQKLYGECVWEELCHFNLLDLLKQNKKRIGIVFNLDEHWKGGSHWVSMFIDVPSKQICYFDSGGDDIPKEVERLAHKIQHQGKTIGIDFKLKKNYPFEHQMHDTECGIYCVYFIISMLQSPNFSKFTKKRITDKEMEKYRHLYFRI